MSEKIAEGNEEAKETAMITVDRNGKVHYVEKGFSEIFGWQENEILGTSINKIVPFPYVQHHDSYLQHYKGSQESNVVGHTRVVQAKHKDGKIFPVHLTISEIQSNNPLFVAIIERVSSKPITLSIHPSGAIISSSNDLQTLLGYKLGEIAGKNVELIIPNLKSYFNKTGILHSHLEAIHKDGNILPVSVKLEIMKMGILELIKASIELLNKKQGVVVVDKKGNIVNSNENCSLISGYTTQNLGKMNIHSLIPEIQVEGEEIQQKAKKIRLETGPTNSKNLQQLDICFMTLIHSDGTPSPISVEVNTMNEYFTINFKRLVKLGNEYKLRNYFILKTIGRGSTGVVHYGVDAETGKSLAMKIISKVSMSASQLERVKRETTILKQLEHPNIAALLNFVETPTQLTILMEYGGLPLLSVIKEALNEEVAHKYFCAILSAVEYCHSLNIIHRDIKHQNVLLNEKGQIKLIDFGLSNFIEEGRLRSTFCGTPAYAAPEMILAKRYSGPEVDIWSLGVVLYSMLTSSLPFESVSDIIQGNYKEPKVSKECADLLSKIFKVKIEERATLKDILHHPWVINGPSSIQDPTLKQEI